MWTFRPILKQTIWGGNRISGLDHHSEATPGTGESLEISGLENCMSIVDTGEDEGMSLRQLIEKYGSKLLGEKNYLRYGDKFPLLVKLLDASAPLSIQVHPDDDTALRHGLSGGKTELWYVLEATDDTFIINGFNRDVTPDDIRKAAAENNLDRLLNKVGAKAGDIHYLPGGRVHALGPGALVVEIQQPCDCTYRLYDYERRDKDGKPRQLHVNLAADTADCSGSEGLPVSLTHPADIPMRVLSSKHFNINLLTLKNELLRDYSETDSFVVLTCVAGKAEISHGDEMRLLSRGCSLLIPASAGSIRIKPEDRFSALESFMP